MALWPNNRQGNVGSNPIRVRGFPGNAQYNSGGGAVYNRHLMLQPTSSTPEGMAPFGSWVWPRKAGGMCGQATASFTGTLNLLNGGAMTGAASMSMQADGSLSLIVYMTGSTTASFTVSPAQLTAILKMSGTANCVLSADGSMLSIINPMTGLAVCTLTAVGDLRGKLSLTGVSAQSDQENVDYGGAVYVADWGVDAFIYPAGTATQPVATLAAAFSIARRYNLHDFYIKGDYTLTETLGDAVIHGWGPKQFNKINLNDQEITNVKFIDCVIEGKLHTTTIGGTGWQSSIARVEFVQCYLQSIEDLQGTADNCQIDGPTLVKAGGWFSSARTVIEGDFTVFDLRNAADTVVSMDIVSGWAQFSNAVAGSLIELNVKGGEVTLAASCTGGEYYLEGVGTLFNDSAMAVKENHLVWDEQTGYHAIAGSTGKALADGGGGGGGGLTPTQATQLEEVHERVPADLQEQLTSIKNRAGGLPHL